MSKHGFQEDDEFQYKRIKLEDNDALFFYDGESSSDESDIELPTEDVESEDDSDINWEDVDLSKSVRVQYQKDRTSGSRIRKKESYYHKLKYGLHIASMPILINDFIRRVGWMDDERLRRRLKRSVPKLIQKKFRKWSEDNSDKRIDSIRTLLSGLVMWFRGHYKVNSNGYRQNFYRLHFLNQLKDTKNFQRTYRSVLEHQELYYGRRPNPISDIEQVRDLARKKMANRDLLTLFFATLLRDLIPEELIANITICFALPLHNFDISPRNIIKLAANDIGKVPNLFDSDLLEPYFWIELTTNDEINKIYTIDPVVHIGKTDIVAKFDIDEAIHIFEPLKDLRLNVTQWFQYVVSIDINRKQLRDVSPRYIPNLYYRYFESAENSVISRSRHHRSSLYFRRVMESFKCNTTNNNELMKTIAFKNILLPKSFAEIRRSNNFRSPGTLKKSEIFRDSSKPFTTIKIGKQNEPLYWKNDVLPLRTKQHWFMLGYTVIDGCKPLRLKKYFPRNRKLVNYTISNGLNEPLYTRELYSIEQTMRTPRYPSYYEDKFGRKQVITDVDFYKNKFSNIEIYSDKVIPIGFKMLETIDHTTGTDVRDIIKSYNKRHRKKRIKYLYVISGFDFKQKPGQAVPVKNHLLLNCVHFIKVQELLEQHHIVKSLLKWDDLLTKLRIKTNLSTRYGDV
ncbi:DNA repair protein RAD34 [Nakaseomyces bracarensis]|uniref:DNA repair protein RAD34 n=1 Tax=Nakaseomyces bracarensis TaxID=273131 RepID=A0ABR4NYE1_9SACH